ncbi:MAG: copper-binding protein [Variibacter sp.]|nr:copper-binding protein [Variibacter sp.]
MRHAIFAAMLILAPLAAHAGSHESGLPVVAGEVRKVDKEAGKLTLKHAAIPNLDMPDMTMVFRVKDPAMLDQVKAGDKVRFAADKVGGQFTVVKIEPAK